MNIEDLVISLNIHGVAKGWDNTFVSSVASQIMSGNGLTDKQSTIVIKILQKYQSEMFSVVGDMDLWLKNPTFRLPTRSVKTNNYRASVVLDENRKKLIKLEFPFNQEYINEIRKEKNLNYSVFDREARAWMIELNESSIKLCISFHEKTPFLFDAELLNLIEQSTIIIQNPETYIPSLVVENGIPTYKNVSPYVPPLTTSDMLTSVLEARKAGINVWDDEIQNFINSQNNIFSKLLNLLNSSEILVDEEESDIFLLTPIIQHMTPTLVIVPAGAELEKLELMYNFLIQSGYQNTDMTVMFRLSSENGGKFNDFVKNNLLNSPLSLTTKFVFICTKIPKPLLKSKIKFNSVINLGYWNVHYTVKEFVKNCQNVVYYTNNKLMKDLQIAYM